MERIVSTMPIKPQKETSIGMMIAPTIMNYLGEALNATKILATNTLNTYKEKEIELPIYLTDIEKSQIQYDYLFNDRKQILNIMSVIQNMADENIIELTTENIMRCNCGKVDILENAIRNYSDGKLYKKNSNQKYICSDCCCECKIYSEPVLTISFEEDKYKDIKIVPTFFKKEVEQFRRSFNDSKILISKARNTGYSVVKNGKEYFVDVDFIWMNYVKLLESDQKILIASNHQLLKMFIMNYINQISNEQDIIFVAHPYINSNDMQKIKNIYCNSQNEYFKKLFLLYQLNWNKKSCNFSDSVIKYLQGISDTRKLNLYKNILEKSKNFLQQYENYYTDEVINKMITNSINMQKNIVDSKKYVMRKESR